MSDLERRLLAHLTDADIINEVYGLGVRAEWFEEPLYQAIWNFTLNYWLNAQMKAAPTAWVLSQEFAGYAAAELTEEEPGYLAVRLKDRYLSNQLQDILRRAATESMINPQEALKELLNDAFVTSEISATRITRLNMANTIEARRERYGRREDYPQGLGVTLGLDLIDMHTGGILPGELAIVGGYAKTGKTWLVLNAAAAAVRQGHHPLVFSLELGLDDTQERLDALVSGVSYTQLSRGLLPLDKLRELHAAQEELVSLGGLAVERPDEEDRLVSALISRARQLGSDYLIIDQLSKLEAGHVTRSTKEQYSSILRQLNNGIGRAGSELPCLLAVQLKREDGEPTIQSFADAAEVERDCDLALTIWRNRDLRYNNQMKCEIVASRRCDTAAWLLDWNLTHGTRIAVREEIRG